MIELLNPTPQTVAPGQGVVYSEEISSKCSAERHRAGSAQLTLVKPGRYLVGFSGNVAIPAGGVVLCMHALYEISSKADVYEAVKGYKAFIEKIG